MEAIKKHQNYIGENAESRLLLLTDTVYPRIEVTFGGNDAARQPMEIDAEQFVGVKGFKAKGKRITTWEVEKIVELEPTRFPEHDTNNAEQDNAEDEKENLDPDAGKTQQQVIDDMTGQLNLFNDNDDTSKS